MTEELPKGWAWATLGDLLAEKIINGRSVPTREGGFPVLRLNAIKQGKIDPSVSKEGAWGEAEAAPYILHEGDFLLSRGNGTISLVGRGGLVSEGCQVAFPDTMMRIRVNSYLLDPKYFCLLWNSPFVRDQIEASARTTAGIYKVNQSMLLGFRIPVPPLAEQRRMSDALEAEISRLDAVRGFLLDSSMRTSLLKLSLLSGLREDALKESAVMVPVGEIAETSLGKMLNSREDSGSPVPYLANINVRWGFFDLSSLKKVPLSAGELQKFSIAEGDLLVCEGGEPGRCAVWRGNGQGFAYQKALHRVRVNSQVKVEWLALMLEESVRRGRISHFYTGTTIKHLPQEKLRAVKIPLPSFEIQEGLVRRYEDMKDGVDRFDELIAGVRGKSEGLHDALLSAAFTGKLVPQDPSDEPASVLLERIRAEQVAAPKAKRGSKAKTLGVKTSSANLVPIPENPQPVSAGEQTALEF